MSAVRKQLVVRRSELADAERLLRSSRLQVEAGERAHAKVLSVQLRALLCETRTNTALLFDLADTVNMTLMCTGVMAEAVEWDEHREYAQLQRWVSVPSWNTSVTQIAFKEWLSVKSVSNMISLGSGSVRDSIEHSPRDLIELHANKLGGAHYDTELDPDHDRMRRTSLRPDGRLTMIEELLIHTSEVAEYHARQVIAELDRRAFLLLESAIEAGLRSFGPSVDVKMTVTSRSQSLGGAPANHSDPNPPAQL